MAGEKRIVSRQSSIIEPPSAGILIIGDEILKGHTKDTNSYFLLTRLWSLGVKVKAVSVISDEVNEIAAHVRDFSSRFTHVLTSGGIGPTHDDVTIPAVAEAFHEPLVENEFLAKTIAKAYGLQDVSQLSCFHRKMARIPSSGKLSYDEKIHESTGNSFPLISVHNVHIFPGIPQFLQSLFDSYCHIFSTSTNMFHLHKVYLSVDESVVAAELQEVHDKYGHKVHLGSYPQVDCQEFQTQLTLESLRPQVLAEALTYLIDKLPRSAVVRTEACTSGEDFSPADGAKQEKGVLHEEPGHSTEKIYSLVSVKDISNLSACVKGAWAVLQGTLALYTQDELCISFNGGKDCTVLLALYYAAVIRKYPSFSGTLKALYVQVDSPFPEAEEFIWECAERYNLEVIVMQSSIKEGLGALQESYPSIRAILMGTRKHDPFSENLNLFSPTDPGWPQFMRINPILNWHYSDIWCFLRECNIPYMSLYDQGYTSIGDVHNTKANPALKIGNDKYKPAYMLEDESKERDGRI